MTTETNVQQPTISAAIIVQDGRVLMVRRRVAEGSLSWQFPAGAIEAGESAEDAAVRETSEEVGLTVRPIVSLGQRVHPATKRNMIYVACEIVGGTARVADTEELAEVAWCSREELPTYVPHGVWEPVQRYLDVALTDRA